MRWWLLVALFCGGLLVVVLYSATDRGAGAPRAEDKTALAERSEAHFDDQAPPSHRESQSDEELSDPTPTARESMEEAALVGWVESSGIPLAGARVSITPLDDELIEKGTPWSSKNWQLVDARTHRVRTATDGHFAVELFGESQRFAIWVTHPKHEAAWRILSPESDQRLQFDLRPSPGVRVRVVDASGTPVASATVKQFGQPGLWADGAGGAISVLLRSTRTDAEGYADLAPLPPDTLALATDGKRRSRPLEGSFRGACQLVLSETFRVHGMVQGAGFAVANPATVIAFAEEGAFSKPLARIGVAEDGSYGPFDVPLDAERYRFYLEGGNAQPATVELDRPDPGATVRVDFEAILGSDVWAFPEAVDGTPLMDAEVTASWQGPGHARGRMTVRPFQEGHAYAGYALLLGVPHGSVTLSATCKGYSPVQVTPFLVPEENTSSWVLTLEKGARVSGRCLYRGEPVRDFEILYWPGVRTGAVVRRTFFDREDGSFEIASAPTGPMQLMAVGHEHPHSEAVGLDLDAGESGEVVLELQDAVACTGRVVDQSTGAPIQGARVQLWTNHMNSLVAPRGVPVAAGAQGEFQLAGLTQGPNTIEFRAKGYSNLLLSAVSDGSEVALGDVALVGTQPLTIQLLGDPAMDFSAYSVDVSSQRNVKGRGFLPSGTCRVEGMGAGRAWVTLREPDGGLQHVNTYQHPGVPGHVVFDVAPTGNSIELLATLEGQPVTQDPSLAARITYRDSLGSTRYVAQPLDGGSAVFHDVPPGPVDVSVWRAGVLVSTQQEEVREGSDHRFTLDLSPPTSTIRVLGPTGDPLTGVAVGLLRHGQIEGWYRTTTDASGQASFSGTQPGEYYVHIHHPTLGQRTDLRVQVVAGSTDPIDVSFDAAITFSLLVESAGHPVSGANCELYSSAGDLYVGKRLTSTEGIASWSDIGAGRYRLGVRHVSYGIATATIDAQENPSNPLRISLRPLGAVEFAIARDGGAAEHAAVELTDGDSGESVALWLRRGLTISSTGSMTPDAEGRVRLERLPAGQYHWQVDEVKGTVSVEAGEVVVVTVRL